MIQIRATPEIYAEVKAQADASGLPIATYARQVLIRVARRPRFALWFQEKGQSPTEPTLRGLAPHYLFERISDDDVGMVGHLLHAHGELQGMPVSDSHLYQRLPWHLAPESQQAALSGDAKSWAIVRTLYDVTAQRVELRLRRENEE